MGGNNSDYAKLVSDALTPWKPVFEGKRGAVQDAQDLQREANKLGTFQNTSKSVKNSLDENRKKMKDVVALKAKVGKIMDSFRKSRMDKSDPAYNIQDSLEATQHEIFKIEMTLRDEGNLLADLLKLYTDWEQYFGRRR